MIAQLISASGTIFKAQFRLPVLTIFLVSLLSGCGDSSGTGTNFDIDTPSGDSKTRDDETSDHKNDAPATPESSSQPPEPTNAPSQSPGTSQTPPPVTTEVPLSDGRRATFTASPNPILDPDSNGLGLTTLSWNCEGVGLVEVHLDTPDGKLFARTGPTHSAPTGRWVVNGMTFFLQDVTDNKPLTAENTLAKLVVNVQKR